MNTRSSPSMNSLRSLAQEAGLNNVDRVAKADLFHMLQQRCNLERLQRAHRRNKRKMPVELDNSSREKKHVCVDPVMLEPLGNHQFKFLRPNGTIVMYNVGSLVQYMLKTGKFCEPETRIEFSNEDLRKLDLQVQDANLKLDSVFAAKQNPKKFEEQKMRRDGILGLERCCGELVCQMMGVIEDCDPEEGEIQLLTNIFPIFADLFQQMRDVDYEYSKHAMNAWQLYIEGPPNRPTEDPYGFLPIVCSFLKQSEQTNQSLDF